MALKEVPGLEAAKPHEDEGRRSVTHAHKIPYIPAATEGATTFAG